MATEDNSIAAKIREIYGIASELTISPDKETQVLGVKLRKLVEHLEQQIR